MLRKAFTLIELVMVIAIIAVLAAIAMPRYAASLARYRLDAAARRVVADLTMAQTRARITSASQTVTFSTATSQYTLAGMADPEHPSATYAVRLSDDPYSATIYSCSFTNAAVTFNGYGLPDGAGAVIIQSGSMSKTVVVDADTGVASIQ